MMGNGVLLIHAGFMMNMNEMNDRYGFQYILEYTHNKKRYRRNPKTLYDMVINIYWGIIEAPYYASGTNHTLPTNGFAKAYSGISIDSFVKKITFQNLSKKGVKNIGKAVEVMAEAEGLAAHKYAMQIRRLK